MSKHFKFLTIFLLFCFLVTSGASCSKGGSTDAKTLQQTQVTLKFWSIYDDSDAFSEIIEDYRKIHPNVTVEYKKLLYEEYEKELLEAFAKDEGPDLFSVHNTWMRKYQPLMSPMPSSVTLPIKSVQGTVKKEEVVELVPQKLYTPSQITTMFGDTVAQDAIMTFEDANRVYGLPLSLDTLALYYNKDILNNASLAQPAQYWTDLAPQVEKIRKLDAQNKLILSAAPLGTSKNVARSFDILSLLMMQLRANMVNETGQVLFAAMPRELSDQGLTVAPGVNAIDFYTSFADPLLVSYNWNADMPNSLDAFINGQSAYFFGYSYHRATIDARAPKLNYSIAPMLQVKGYQKVNYANYWFNGVAKKSANQDWAWDFVRFMSTKDEAAKYLTATKKPAALRALYDTQMQDDTVSVFTEQTLTAKSWYRGLDSNAAEDIFAQMIDSVSIDKVKTKDAAELAAIKIQQTWRQ